MSGRRTNERHLDPFIESIRERYTVETLRDWPLDKLAGEEWRIRLEFETFEIDFPPSQSFVQGEDSVFHYDNPNDDKESLTSTEKRRLRNVKHEASGEVNRAIGIKERERREEKNAFIMKLSGLIKSSSEVITAIAKLDPFRKS